jgi:3-deoxy-D-manno-octulosonic-acid transferase
MSRSIGLTLYSVFAEREPAPTEVWPDRPAGRLIWLHAPSAGAMRPLAELARRLREEDGYPVLVTCPEPLPPQAGLVRAAAPLETAAAARAFLDHWQPEVAVFSEGELRPILLNEVARRDIPAIMVDARAPFLPGNRRGWWPGLVRQTLGRFARILALDEAAARQFRKRGAPENVVRVEGRMEDGSSVLPCTEAERAALVRLFQTRPVWLAVGVPEAEDAAVIAAHRSALRLAHRLLLILVPDVPERAETLARQLEATDGWVIARRSADEEPDEETHVFLADVPSELGLWYRLAPITFLGGSLYGGGSLRDPFEAAALGSALLHGPQAGQWRTALARLTEARASRQVSSPLELADGLSELLSPDRAARLAQGAWAVASAGTEVTDRVVLLVREVMEAEV